MPDDEVILAEIGGRKVLMLAVEYEGFCRDQDEYGQCVVDVDERGFGVWVPAIDYYDDAGDIPSGCVFSA